MKIKRTRARVYRIIILLYCIFTYQTVYNIRDVQRLTIIIVENVLPIFFRNINLVYMIVIFKASARVAANIKKCIAARPPLDKTNLILFTVVYQKRLRTYQYENRILLHILHVYVCNMYITT